MSLGVEPLFLSSEGRNIQVLVARCNGQCDKRWVVLLAHLLWLRSLAGYVTNFGAYVRDFGTETNRFVKDVTAFNTVVILNISNHSVLNIITIDGKTKPM